MKSIRKRLGKLEQEYLDRHPGRARAWKWIKVINNEPVLRWIFSTELTRPDRIPKSIMNNRNQKEAIRHRMNLWRENRKSGWCNLHPSCLGITDLKRPRDGLFQERIKDLPAEIETRRAFGLLSACIDSLSFEWARAYIMLYQHLPIEKIAKNDGDDYWLAFSFLWSESRAKYWQRKLGQQDIGNLPHPDWVKEKIRAFQIHSLTSQFER